MGLKVGRIVKEFVFNALVDKQMEIDLHGDKKDLTCKVVNIEEDVLGLEIIRGEVSEFSPSDDVRVFFFFQNNYHCFDSRVVEVSEGQIKIEHPEGVYKNPQRKYERIKLKKPVEVYFTLRGEKIKLNFPKAKRILTSDEVDEARGFESPSMQELLREFRAKMAEAVSYNHISMMRNKSPGSYEEKLLVSTGKILWIPSTEEDFPFKDPFPDERVIIKRELVDYEKSFNTPAYIITSKLGNQLYEKQKKKIFSEVYCPILFDQYLVGYIYCANLDGKKEKISSELLDYISQFAKVLCYALETNGYFKTESNGENRYRAEIIDLSASGLLFAYPQEAIAKDLLIHTDLDLTLSLGGRRIVAGSRIRRKFKDKNCMYFGAQFLKIEQADFRHIFELLYGHPFSQEEEDKWEGGAPPPPLELFEDESELSNN